MLKSYKVIHLSNTPLVGAPGKISKALQNIDIDSTSYCLNDYPNKGPLYKFFTEHSHVINSMNEFAYKSFLYELEAADIIHIHNDLSPDFLSKIYPYCQGSKLVYQVHSPLREGPLFYDRTQEMGLDFSIKLVVAQYQPRQYQSYQCVPNLILDKPSFIEREKADLLKVLYSPSHTRTGRWNAKCSVGLDEQLTVLTNANKINLVKPLKPVTPKDLMLMRKYCDLSIDEIVTGAYHQVSLEGLCAGNIVLNKADYFSKVALASVAKSKSLPPFTYADASNVLDVILEFSGDINKCNEVKEANFNYFREYLAANKLIMVYRDIYDEII